MVIEDRYSQLFKLDRIRPAVVADGLAELQIRWPNVPVVFCETRQLAEEYTYRFLAAANAWATPNTLPCNVSHRSESTSPTSTRHPQRRRHPPAKSAPGLAAPAYRYPTGRLRPEIWTAWYDTNSSNRT
ncbi:ERCC4-type nuclease [Mycobacterium xenopi]|nr:ERCC4-type nuclease [Mycobacterium xenopi]